MNWFRKINSILIAVVVAWMGGGRALATPPQVTCSSILGGMAQDTARDVCFDAQGNLYLTGGTASPDFPVTLGPAHNAGMPPVNPRIPPMDVFVAKFSPNGLLLWSRFIGGRNYDRAYAIEVDPQGGVYVSGRAGRAFPTTAGVLQPQFAGFYTGAAYGEQNAFLCKLDPNGNLLWSTYFGTSPLIRDIAIARVGGRWDVFVGGTYMPQGGLFPAAWFANGFQRQPAGGMDGVVARVTGDGRAVAWATYLGGSGDDSPTPSIRVTAEGEPVVYFSTQSADLPTRLAADSSYNGGHDMYLAKLAPNGGALRFATYLGGSRNEGCETHGLAISAVGDIYAGGMTLSSPVQGFPVTAGAAQTQFGGGLPGGDAWHDGFVARYSALGQLLACTYVGGREQEAVEGVVFAEGRVVISGNTTSTAFPCTADAAQPALGGGSDMFVAVLSADLGIFQYSTYCGGAGDDHGRTMASRGRVICAAGQAGGGDFPVVGEPRRAYGGGLDAAWIRLVLP